jgi:hypothetical protein
MNPADATAPFDTRSSIPVVVVVVRVIEAIAP